MPKILTVSELFKSYRVRENHLNEDAPLQGCLYETQGDELEHIEEVAERTPKRVWTLLDAGERDPQVAQGFIQFNQLGFFITG